MLFWIIERNLKKTMVLNLQKKYDKNPLYIFRNIL
jgi:hypothetical protein